jgi:FKBP-type peptidyl-prolyl cis-trans isomerase
MKKAILTVALSSLISSSIALAGGHAPQTDEEKFGYALGRALGGNLLQIGLSPEGDKIDFEMLKQGIEDTFNGAEIRMSEEDIAAQFNAFQRRKAEEKNQQMAALAVDNLESGKAYRDENGKKAGVTTTATGLQIEILEQGDGAKPTAEDSVKVHYRGTLITGEEFDSSYGRGEPVTFPLNGVIRGWTEGLQLINQGGKARLVIPSELAYGPGGAGDMIGPNATLVFEVELLEINPAQ